MTDKPSASERRKFTWYNCTQKEMIIAGHRSDGECHQYKEVVHLIECDAIEVMDYEALERQAWKMRDENAALTAEVAEWRTKALDVEKHPVVVYLTNEVDELKAEVEGLNFALEQKSGEIGRAEHRGNTVDYIYDKLETYSKQLCGLQPDRDAWRSQCEKLAEELAGQCWCEVAILTGYVNCRVCTTLAEFEAFRKERE